MKKRILALITALMMAAATLGVGTALVSQAAPDSTTQTAPKKCKKCKKVIKKAKKCKKNGNNSAKCKKFKKKAKKCKKVLKSKKCKKSTPRPTPSPSGSGGSGGTGTQEVTGEIQQPAYYFDPNTQEVTCYSGKHRRGAVLTDGANQGVDGYHFDVDQKTIGKNFVLTADGGEGTPDLDITFYDEFGTPEQLADPTYAPVSVAFETRGPGGETGTVPAGMKLAIVCMLDGANVPFTYKTGASGSVPTASPSPSAS